MITLKELEKVVLHLSNEVSTRYWKHWNYPVKDPWIMAIEVKKGGNSRRLEEELLLIGFRIVSQPDEKKIMAVIERIR